jgi:hypothetical protein
VQDISAQTRVRAKDRMRIVKMATVQHETPAPAATTETEKSA